MTMRYEYCIVHLDMDEPGKEKYKAVRKKGGQPFERAGTLIDILNFLGADRWHLVSSYHLQSTGKLNGKIATYHNSEYVHILERVMVEE